MTSLLQGKQAKLSLKLGRESIMMMYIAMIRSAIDYGCMIYGSAAPSVISKLNIVQAKAFKSVQWVIPYNPNTGADNRNGEDAIGN